MNIEHKNPNPNKLKRTQQVLGSILATAALSGIGAVGYDRYQDNKEARAAKQEQTLKAEAEAEKARAWEQDQAAAVEIAKRFTDCKIEAFTDTRTTPEEGGFIANPQGRTTLKLRVSLNETEKAQTEKAPYEDNDRVIWYPPAVALAINPDRDDLNEPPLGETYLPPNLPPSGSELAQVTRKESAYPATLDVELYPRTEYPDGKQARIFIKESVTASDTPERRLSATGYTDCGAMVFDGKTHTWKLIRDSSAAEPVAETKLTMYEDNDGDNVWWPVK